MGRREEMVKLAEKMMQKRENIRNIGIVAHIDHGKTTMTDNLIAAAGLMSDELAGKQLFMDFYELEQQRGITINAANISLVHKFKDKEYLINVIDTPGHIDFGGEVIRAMRAVDGVVVVVDSVEGVMPQTETVIRQALREKVKPSLFINKVDRIVNELQLTEEQMQERFIKTITQVNKLIKTNAPKEYVEKWQVKVNDGSVSFGSAYYNWALNIHTMKETGISFKDVYQYCKNQDQKTLAKKSPLHVAILGMVIEHLPNPIQAQKYRIEAIWTGDLESEAGKAMVSSDEKGPFSMMVTDVTVDPHAGDIATGRIYSGTIRSGMKVKLLTGQKEVGVQQVVVFMGPERITVSEVPCGNIAGLVGVREIWAGETISSSDMKPFESFKSTAEPVMTVSVEPKQTKDLPKLIEVIRQITKEDPNIVASLNQETGEHLISGMGELHLEVTQYRIEKDHKIAIDVSPPIVVYRETITKGCETLEGKSPNKHNKFKMRVEPIPKEQLEKLVEAKLDKKVKPKDKEMIAKFEEMGFDRETSRRIWAVHNNNLFVDFTRGIVALYEIREMVIQAFQDAMNEGPLAKEKCMGIKVILEDSKLHEDAIHRGPAQVLPAVTRTIYACMLSSNPVLLEPKQTLFITVPEDYMGAVSKELGQRRTQITEMKQEGDASIFIAKAPVKELIGFSASIRGATQGRAIWTAEYSGYEQLPREMQDNVVAEVRKRKGLDPKPKSAQFFLE
ncbi:MAG: elongation factor EF-2 [Candidatus Diapherotrites archaeon]|uniref:Elongation factor 2 n=1 Tax=Candidatus Iainarchaeum sp. TaxID=3101447 RepID=A0A938YSL1_9ARCH|nr:elongation factor EF-2 [Candidatus Diapherotrites archaeon]